MTMNGDDNEDLKVIKSLHPYLDKAHLRQENVDNPTVTRELKVDYLLEIY